MSTSGFFDPVAARRWGAIKTWGDFDESYTDTHFGTIGVESNANVGQFTFGAPPNKTQKRTDSDTNMINELYEIIKSKNKIIAEQAANIIRLQSEIEYINQSKYDYYEIAQKNKPVTREIKKLSKFFKF